MDLTTITTLIAEIGVLVGVIIPIISSVRKIANGQKCQLRSDMLHIYYKHKDSRTIRQYELENFCLLYGAYKQLGGNSFIDIIKNEVIDWEVIS